MIIGFAGCRMTAKDHRLCTRVLVELASAESPLAPRLRDKLEAARIVDAEGAARSHVRLGSRVEYSMNGAAPVTRVLVEHDRAGGTAGLTLPVGTLPGLTLLGMREGQSCSIHEGGRTQILTVHHILNKPEIPCRTDGRMDGMSARVIDFADARAARSNLRDSAPESRPNPIQAKERR